MIEASDDKCVNIEAAVATRCPKADRITKYRLSSKEILDNSIMLLFDEMSKNTLAHVSYLLAINPSIQTELQSEIDNFYRHNPVYII